MLRLSSISLLATALIVAHGQHGGEELTEVKDKTDCYKNQYYARLSRYCQDPIPKWRMGSKNGIFTIFPNNIDCDKGDVVPMDVYCDQKTDGGGWIVIQRRWVRKQVYRGKKLIFYRNWKMYREGFGKLGGEFWLGLRNINRITRTGDFELRVNLDLFGKPSTFAKYSNFSVLGEKKNFQLQISGYSGTAGDSLSYHNGKNFTTYDRDNDGRDGVNCAEQNWGAWWYSDGDRGCHRSNLNGRYNRWFKSSPVKRITMMVRRKDRILRIPPVQKRIFLGV